MPLPDTGTGLTQSMRDQIDKIYQYEIDKGNTRLANDWLSFANTFWAQHPNLTLKQVADAFVAKEVAPGIGKAVQGIGTFVGSDVPNAAASAAESLPNPQNAIPGLAQIGDFFHALGQASTWIRVAEVLLGLGLIAVGIAHMTKAIPAATKVAKTLGAAAVL